MELRTIHKISGSIIFIFFALHLANHLASLSSVEAHIQLMQSFRTIYRNILVESVLLLAVTLQIYSGIKFAFRGWKTRRGFVPWLQVGAGLYMAFFFLNHVGAVLAGRLVLQLDTNFYYAIAGIHVSPFQYFFIPYYFLAVVALFTHVGCALYWHFAGYSIKWALPSLWCSLLLGVVCSSLVVLAMSGAFYSIEVPHEYEATYQIDF